MLELGGHVPSITNFCDWDGTICNLKSGTFGGTREMSFSRTEAGLISQFHFNYGVTSIDSVKEQIEDYTRRLGKPTKDSTTRSGEIVYRQLEWSDAATTFRFDYKADRKQVEASATLFDKALAADNQ